MTDLVWSILWWLTVSAFLSAILLVVSVTVFNVLHGCLVVSKCKDVPSYKTYPILTYAMTLAYVYRQRYPRVIILQIMFALCRIFGREKIGVIWLGSRPIVFFYRPESVEVLLNNSTTISKSAEYDFLKIWLGTGLLTSDGDKWRSHRKLLTPAFHFQILETFLPSFNEQASILTKKLELEVEKEWIDIVPQITMCTLDIICETAMGVHLNTQSGCCKEYIEAISEVSDIFIYRLVRPWLWFDPIFLNCFPAGWKYRRNIKRIHDFTRKVSDEECMMHSLSETCPILILLRTSLRCRVLTRNRTELGVIISYDPQVIKEKKEYMFAQNNGKSETISEKPKRKAFLELLLEHHLKDESFTEENVREEVDTFMFEGHDTTAMSISWTLYELGRHPEIQDKVFQELDDIFGSDGDREVTSEDLKKMKYLELVIKETLRLFPSVAFIARQLKEKLKIDNYTLMPGCTCFICVFVLHKDPEQFPLPEVFNPDRFLPENNNTRHPYAYIPFSAGPRNCIGQRFALMEEKTILAHILRKFRINSLDPQDKIETLAGLVMKNAEPIRIHCALREYLNT